jgi:hypothetical protein
MRYLAAVALGLAFAYVMASWQVTSTTPRGNTVAHAWQDRSSIGSWACMVGSETDPSGSANWIAPFLRDAALPEAHCC